MSYGWIGWNDAGHVDRLGPESLATDFFYVVIPVWPANTSKYKFVTPSGERATVLVPRDRRSVVLGLIRTPLALVTTVLVTPIVIDWSRWGWLWPVAVAAMGAAAWAMWGAGRLPRAEFERRALLRRVSGVGIPPEWLADEVREGLGDDLAERWIREFGSDWRTAIHAGVASEVLVALAEYAREPQLMIRARTNLIDRGGN